MSIAQMRWMRRRYGIVRIVAAIDVSALLVKLYVIDVYGL